jgi:hypothetical protein
MPRVLIVGTSNSLRGAGYVKHLGDSLGAGQIRNASLGASASTHVIRSLKGIDFADFDYCVVDLSVNEDVLLRFGVMEAEVSRTVIDAIVARALSAGCLPIILVLPRLLRPDQAPIGRPLHLEHARRWGLPVLDAYLAADRLREIHGATDQEIFHSAPHVDNWVAAAIAHALADFMDERQDLRWDAAGAAPADLPLLGEEAVAAEGFVQVDRATSKFSGRFTQVSHGAVLRASAGRLRGIVGVVVNLSATHGVLRIEGETGAPVLIDLRNSYFNDPRFPVVIASLPLPRVLRPDADGRVSIAILAPDEIGAEMQLRSAEEELGASAAIGPPQLEIESLQGLLGVEAVMVRKPAPGIAVEVLAGHRMRLLDVAAAVYRDQANPEVVKANFEAKRQRKLARKAARTGAAAGDAQTLADLRAQRREAKLRARQSKPAGT